MQGLSSFPPNHPQLGSAGSGIATFNIRRSLRKNKQQQLELEAGKHPGHHSAPTPFGSGE